LLDKPVSLLSPTELRKFRRSLIESGIKASTVVRVLKSARASLNLAASLDPRCAANREAWKTGLSGLVDSYQPVSRVLSDDDVLKLVAAAHAIGPHFGLVVDVLASTGTRTSQACNLLIRDLQDGPAPRLMMPSSKKGKGRKQVTRRPVPISKSLSVKLARAAGKRAPDEPLLTRADGSAWNPKKQELQKLFQQIAESTGIGGTAYQLRHSAIVRSIVANVPLRVIAAQVDSSTLILERVYSAFVLDHADQVARQGLLDTDAPRGGNVVSLRKGRR
jgi:integrase